MKKILALVLALTMVLALAACGSSAPAAEAPAAEAPAADAPAAAPAAGDDLAGWKAYLEEYAKAGAPTEEDAQAVISQIEAAGTAAEVEAISELSVLFESVGVLTYDAWIAAGKPAAQAAGIGSEADKQGNASAGEASGEPTGEPGDIPAGSSQANEAHGGTAGATSEADYKAYLKAWLAYENSVNTNMTDESVSEFEALIDAGNYTDFPADMLFSGMLVTGSAMTYDQFVAANGVY